MLFVVLYFQMCSKYIQWNQIWGKWGGLEIPSTYNECSWYRKLACFLFPLAFLFDCFISISQKGRWKDERSKLDHNLGLGGGAKIAPALKIMKNLKIGAGCRPAPTFQLLKFSFTCSPATFWHLEPLIPIYQGSQTFWSKKIENLHYWFWEIFKCS